jgi:outer membrane protein OmpA-like peptidoglycan-associated protein
MYLTESKKKLLAVFGIIIALFIMGAFVWELGPFKQNVEVVETAPSTTLPATTESQSSSTTRLSCQDISILFDINKTEPLIDLDSYQDCFDWFADQINKGVFKTINVIGRSSCDSSQENGDKISQDRANLIARELLDAGIPAFLINAQGIGYSKPIGDCKTTKGAIVNRSVIITGV